MADTQHIPASARVAIFPMTSSCIWNLTPACRLVVPYRGFQVRCPPPVAMRMREDFKNLYG